MKKAALYVRVSTQEQKLHGMSVDTQITALEAYCKANNLAVYKIYNDVNKNVYIGETVRPIEKRWQQHKNKFQDF